MKADDRCAHGSRDCRACGAFTRSLVAAVQTCDHAWTPGILSDLNAASERFARLWAEAEPAVESALRKKIRSSEDRADLAAEVTYRAWKFFADYQPDRSFERWAVVIAERTIADFYRDRKRLLASLTVNDEESVGVAVDPAPSPHTDAEREELSRLLASGIADLSPNRRTVIRMFVNGHLLEEIAERLGTSSNRVSQLLADARKKLSEHLRTHEYPDPYENAVPLCRPAGVIRNRSGQPARDQKRPHRQRNRKRQAQG